MTDGVFNGKFGTHTKVVHRERQVKAHISTCPMIKTRDRRRECNAWAPGEYICKCDRCGELFAGAKRSTVCADCAYGTPHKVRLTPLQKELVDMREQAGIVD